MKKFFFLLTVLYSFLIYGQKEIRGNNPPPPPSKDFQKIQKIYNVDDNLVYFKIDKLSNSFDFLLLKDDKMPLENVFIISFIIEKDYNLSRFKIEKGKNEVITNELKRLINFAKFPPTFMNDKISSFRSYRLKSTFDYKNKTLKTVLLNNN